MVAPSIFIAAAPAGAISNTSGLSNETFPFHKVLVSD